MQYLKLKVVTWYFLIRPFGSEGLAALISTQLVVDSREVILGAVLGSAILSS